MKNIVLLLLPGLLLGSQETPQANRVAWLEGFPEPLPQGVNEVALEVTSQLLRPDMDLAYLVPFGDPAAGGRFGASLQLPTGRREDFSGSGGWDGLVGAALWKRWGGWRLHGQAERVFLSFPADSPYHAVLDRHSYSRVWTGGGWQGEGSGFFAGLGLDLTLAYTGSPYAVGIRRMDQAGWQQHWTFTHHALPRWSFGLSEEAGTYFCPDVTFYVRYRP